MHIAYQEIVIAYSWMRCNVWTNESWKMWRNTYSKEMQMEIQDGGLEGGCILCRSVTPISSRGYLFLHEAIFAAYWSPGVHPIWLLWLPAVCQHIHAFFECRLLTVRCLSSTICLPLACPSPALQLSITHHMRFTSQSSDNSQQTDHQLPVEHQLPAVAWQFTVNSTHRFDYTWLMPLWDNSQAL